jgi:NAD(P)-dependent dehydrogenase (short-subunit alcohol dehydrogenase family)
MSSNNSVWLVTGCSTGFGRELSRILLRRGHSVVLTARNPATLDEFSSADNALVTALDVTVPEQIVDVVRQALARFGKSMCW